MLDQVNQEIEKMIDCTFVLNDLPMSSFKINGRSFDAFSGYEGAKNQLEFACLAGVGAAIPPGTYYIVDRPTGLLGSIRSLYNGKGDWFALYGIDDKVDDQFAVPNTDLKAYGRVTVK